MKAILIGVLLMGVLMSGCIEVDSRLLDSYNEARARDVVERFIKNVPTYQMGGKSLRQISMYSSNCGVGNSEDGGKSPVCWRAVYEFDSEFKGYGYREGADLVPGKVKHTIEVKLKEYSVVSGVIDGEWDAVEQKAL